MIEFNQRFSSATLKSDGVYHDEDYALLNAITRTGHARARDGAFVRSASIDSKPSSAVSSGQRRHSFNDTDDSPSGRKNFIITQKGAEQWKVCDDATLHCLKLSQLGGSLDTSQWEHLYVDSEPEVR